VLPLLICFTGLLEQCKKRNVLYWDPPLEVAVYLWRVLCGLLSFSVYWTTTRPVTHSGALRRVRPVSWTLLLLLYYSLYRSTSPPRDRLSFLLDAVSKSCLLQGPSHRHTVCTAGVCTDGVLSRVLVSRVLIRGCYEHTTHAHIRRFTSHKYLRCPLGTL
jgi:hypothetical protein